MEAAEARDLGIRFFEEKEQVGWIKSDWHDKAHVHLTD